ncbi:FAD-binding oxidoreductase [Reticulibacter mediterranei]|uniref:FAD-binding oxidoreductase n=1 Tax=Reticulibacter mediterranei TaxID=2778369 RepID=A0A8J3IGW2_9CHLR|nr:D-arabinono-1,4-lactone oxidase [Reticulibacter mediterranei]GHO95279.1 FAD-binding oxidoreductase [Reticulibacter mediterranei]
MSTGQTQWSNWSGVVECSPEAILKPKSIEDVSKIVQKSHQAGNHVRVVGSGHSFTPVVQTNGILLSLDNLQGIEQIDIDEEEGNTVTVLAGTRLKKLGEELFDQGLAQENLGDIDEQSIAGAISTGTHGTGARFGTISTQIVGLTLVTASGELLECSPEQHPDIFKAAQVSLGMLGVIVRVKLRVVPFKRLHFQSHRLPLSECLDNLERYKQENSHFEFFWLPYTNDVQAKFTNETDTPLKGKNVLDTLWGNFNKVVLENGVYWLFSEACRLRPQLCQPVSRLSASLIASVDEVEYSHRIFATPRWVRFNEMEYNIPAEHARSVVQEVQECINRNQFAVHFPIECRFVHADDIWLSPAYQRESFYVAVHMYCGMPYKEYFRQVEEIFRRYQGRPHWGKLHTQDAYSLTELYPRWHDFRRVRARLDPQGVFLNDYLRLLFETDAPVPALEDATADIKEEEETTS